MTKVKTPPPPTDAQKLKAKRMRQPKAQLIEFIEDLEGILARAREGHKRTVASVEKAHVLIVAALDTKHAQAMHEKKKVEEELSQTKGFLDDERDRHVATQAREARDCLRANKAERAIVGLVTEHFGREPTND